MRTQQQHQHTQTIQLPNGGDCVYKRSHRAMVLLPLLLCYVKAGRDT